MKKIKILISILFLISMSNHINSKSKYPIAPSDTCVSDNYFGLIVSDPYRPLENDSALSTIKWITEENQVTEAYLSAIPYREKIKERLRKLNNYKKRSLPSKENDGRYYFFENDGLQNQAILFRSFSPDGEKEIFLDPNSLSDNGTVALQNYEMSKDGKYTAYTVAKSGSDWNEIYVMETETKKLLPDHIEWVKFSSPQWYKDGFFYSSYPKPEPGKEFSNANKNHKVFYHKLGTPQSEDKLIYEDNDNPLHFHVSKISPGEDYLFIFASGEGVGSSIIAKKLEPEGEWFTIEPTQDNVLDIIDVKDGMAYLVTNENAPKFKLIKIDLSDPQNSKREIIIPESGSVISDIKPTKDFLVVTYEKDASNHIVLYDRNGQKIDEINLPTLGSVATSTSHDDNDVFYSLTSFVYPSSIFSYNVEDNQSTTLFTPQIEDFNLNDYVTEQIFCRSKDGTVIPVFLTYKKGAERNGKNPLYLYGYGGFNISLTPGFTANRLLWLENGGIYAQANLRGGGEYGEEWHLQGTKLNKKNVFDDFISIAEELIDKGWTSPENIAIEGGSNGGLLVGAVVNMRPDLFKVAIPRVGVLDMMRYHLFTIGWNWASDYGRSDESKEMAEYLLSYSPLHNITTDKGNYPAILVTTADHDDRVVPAHSFKYAATLQEIDPGVSPKLIRIDSNAGHGAGKPLTKHIDEYADIYTFIFNNLGIEPDL